MTSGRTGCDNSASLPQANMWENALQLTGMRTDSTRADLGPLIIGRCGTPPPPSQPPSLTSSLESTSSSGSFEERYAIFAAGALRQDDVVAEVAKSLARMRVEPVPGRVPDVDITDIEQYDAEAIIQDVLNYNPTEEDRALLDAPYLTFYKDLPLVDNFAAAEDFEFGAYD